MERRRERRISAQPANGRIRQMVRATMLSGDGATDPVEAALLDYSGRGMRIELGAPAEPGTAIRIEMDEQIILGEVCYSQRVAAGRYAVGVELEQSLKNLEDLTRLMRALVDDNPARATSRPAA